MKKANVPIPPELNIISGKVVEAALEVHSALGPGLLEGVYEICLFHELQKRGLKTERQVSLPVIYDGIKLDEGLRLDMLVEDALVIELKAIEEILPVHLAQILTYLKLSGRRLGLLINFNVARIKDGIKRVVL
ncbi:MAG: GxxExxY protein [Thermodesulfobacteriota bacterium]